MLQASRTSSYGPPAARVYAREVATDAFDGFICKLCRCPDVARSYRLQRHAENTERFLAAACARCGLFQTVYDWEKATRAQLPLEPHGADRFHPLWESEPELAANRAKARHFARALDAEL